MAQDATQVRVALSGHVWYEPNLAATILTTLGSAPTATAVDLGFTTDEGVTFTIARSTTDIPGWPSVDPLRIIVESEAKNASFGLRQFSRDQWLASMGGAITTSGGVHRWEPDEGSVIEGMIFIDMVDDDINYRFGFRRAMQAAEVSFSLVRGDSLILPNDWRSLAAGGGAKSWFMDTDDPNFAPATQPVIQSVLPAGAAVGGEVLITGTRLGTSGSDITALTIDGISVVDKVWISPTQVIATIPAGVSGAAAVILTTTSGGASASFAYTAA